MDFTVEEVNLMCVFDYSARDRLIRQLRGALPELMSEELRDLAESVVRRLEKISDEAYDAAKDNFYPEYADYDAYDETGTDVEAGEV